MGRSETYRRKTSQLAGRQHGHVTRRQLLALGIPATTIAAWIRDGFLVPIHAGVYAVGYRRVEAVARAMAAVLACGDGAVLSHDSALALWGLRRWSFPAEVTVTGDRRPTAITVHRSRTLTRADTTTQLGVPCTRAARAIHDMGGRLTERQRTRLANRARLDRIVTLDEFEGLVGHRRNASRSGIEDDAHRWLTRHGFTGWATNTIVNGHEADVYFVDARVIVELDHPATHLDTFAADRERDAHNLDHGVATVRMVRGRLTDKEAARLRRILRDRGRD